MILKNLLLGPIKRLHVQNKLIFKPKTSKKVKCLALSLLQFVRDKIPFFDKPEDKIAKYWEYYSREEVIQIADELFEEERYLDLYEHLNRIKYSQDIEVIWRLARALYHLSLIPDITQDVRKEMIEEAYEILRATIRIGNDKANYHKWTAVILNTRNGLESLEDKIRGYPKIRDHLVQASILNPRDFTVQYMLGRWHFEMANLTWFQRKIAKYLFLEPPKSTFQEAYKHLYKAEELNPRSFMPSMYLLALVCMKLGQYYRAKYYLNMALNLPTHSECEKCCLSNAKFYLNKLRKYDLGKDLLYEYHFGFGD